MIDFTPVYDRTKSVQSLADDMSVADLRTATTELFDLVYDMIAECADADVTFDPVDPAAKDDAAASAEEVNIAWTLGHVIVHLTASCEESAALAAEAARGVAFHGRSRAETPWETVTTLAQVRQRLAESHRMCLGSLDMWPDSPQLDGTTEAWPGGPVIDARGRYLIGLLHADSHIGQLRDVIGQGKAALSR